MPLIKCKDCGTEVSDSAVACPKCSCPIATTAGQKAAKTFFSVFRILAVTALILVIGFCALVIYLNKHGHDVRLGDAAKEVLTPKTWNDRATVALNQMFDRDGRVIAKSILNCTHPTGKNPFLNSYSVNQSGDHLSVMMDVKWFGGLTSTPYITRVSWELNEQKHIAVILVGDNAPVPVLEAGLHQLDNYFRGEVYPAVTTNAR